MNRDVERRAAASHTAGLGDGLDLGDAEVEAFERNLRDQERRRLTITASVMTLAAVGAILKRIEHDEMRRFFTEYEIDCGAHWKIHVRYTDLGSGSYLTFDAASPLGFELTDLGAGPSR